MHLSDSQLMISSQSPVNNTHVNNAGRFRSEVFQHTFMRARRCYTTLDSTKGLSRGSESLASDLYTDNLPSTPDEEGGKSGVENASQVDSNKSFDSLLEGRRIKQGSQNESTGPVSQASDASEDYFTFDYLPYNPAGTGNSLSKSNSPAVHLENPERETRWYFKYFLGRLHQLYCGYITERDPFLLAISKSDVQSYGISQYRSILWRKTGSQKLCISHNPSASLSPKKVLNFFDICRVEKGPKEILNFEVQKDALNLEEQEGSVNFKFGVLYCIEGQSSDEEMYNNEKGSEEFNNFVRLLGERINLKSWDRFRGGLDTKTDTTGIDSVYTTYDGHEIMFHISTFLPFSTENRQQIERKRHVGNDIVNIIFVDGRLPNMQPTWSPSMMKTHFTQESVPCFGPPLPNPPEFSKPQEFREFLLVKLINGEKAAFHSPVFAQKRERTLEMLLHVICSNGMGETAGNALSRRAFSDVVVDSLNGITTGKEQNRNDIYIRFGQMLKLNTIIRGDAPTSCITSGQTKKNVWQPRRFHTTFQQEIICGDIWGEQLIVGTDYGTFAIKENQNPVLMLDRSIEVKQLEVIDQYEVIVARYDKGRESRLAVLPLADSYIGQPIDRTMVKRYCLDKTRGCHLFALSKHLVLPARMAVAVHRKIVIFQWQLTTGQSLSSWNQFAQTPSPDSFQFVREIALLEHVHTLSFLEGIPSGRLCIGYRNQFEVWDERNRETYLLHRSESSHNQVVCAKELWDEEEPELILCFTRTCHIQRMGNCLLSSSIIGTTNPVNKRTFSATNSPPQESGTALSRTTLIGADVMPGSASGFPMQSSLSEEKYRSAGGSSPEKAGISGSINDEKGRCNWEFDFTWNFEPKDIVILLPYLFAFARTAIEIRLINNGSLVRTMLVPDCHLIAYKNACLLFSSTSENLDRNASGGSNYAVRKVGATARKRLTTQKFTMDDTVRSASAGPGDDPSTSGILETEVSRLTLGSLPSSPPAGNSTAGGQETGLYVQLSPSYQAHYLYRIVFNENPDCEEEADG